MARILIIDDDQDLAGLLTILLRSWGYEVASAGDPASGLSAARKFRPDLILLDYHMPGETGAHLFETLRRNAATSRTPVIFMSAVASSDQVLREIAEPTLSRFLPKPVHMPQLQEAIRSFLGAAQAS